MNAIIEKGSLKMYIFLLTGIFLALASSYSLYTYLQTNQFVSEYPGDWDKPLGIALGLFLIIRSTKFARESRNLFIKIAGDQLIYRTLRSDSVRKITLTEIEKIQEKDDKIVLITKDHSKSVIVDFNKVRLRDNIKESIKKSLLELNR
jgi:hypothetical protein